MAVTRVAGRWLILLMLCIPLPGWPQDDSMKVVFQVSDGNPESWSMTLANATNVAKQYPDRSSRALEVVAYGSGVEGLRFDSPFADRVQQAQQAGIRIVVCENTLKAKHYTAEDLLPGLDTVPLGVVEIVNKQKAGYAYIRP